MPIRTNISNILMSAAQKKLCSKYGAEYLKTPARLKVGISENVKKRGQPVHGLRHAPEGETSGWYDKNLLKVSSKNDKKLDQFIEITRKVVAKGDIKDYLPTLYLVKRHHIIALDGIPADIDHKTAAGDMVKKQKLKKGTEYFLAFKIGHHKIRFEHHLTDGAIIEKDIVFI